ncbi:hypothetical protein evm_009241 [Chilo suppressalis]|nr:hypothetical protein evm_009241 [Chilo suppressalis]
MKEGDWAMTHHAGPVRIVPGSHFDMEYGMTRVGSLLRQHCCIPTAENKQWPLLAQASSIGSFGKEPKLWLTGDFLHHFTKIKSPPQVLSQPPQLKLIYPSLENVRQSHDNLLGGGCLPYAADAHTKQLWLNDFLYQWKATSTNRNKAMPHIKTYTRVSPDHTRAGYYLLTSGNVSKAAWGQINKKDQALRVMSYEAGVLFLPQFVLICFWCMVVAAVRAQQVDYYAPQTFKQNVDTYGKALFSPARNDVTPQGSNQEPWRPKPLHQSWAGQAPYSAPAPSYPKPEPWRAPLQLSKEQQASIIHHKQALTSEGSFQFEYSSDNGLSAGEVIEPDGSRVGAYQYKDPSGQLVKLKYRAGKDGFQILEGSHIPKSPEPVPPLNQDNHYMSAYQQQKQQYELQQQYNQQRPEPQQQWNSNQNQRDASRQYYTQNWRPGTGQEDDGQYRENDIDNKGPHTFGEGYSFAFQG